MTETTLQAPEPRSYLDIYKKLIELWNGAQEYKKTHPGWMLNPYQESQVSSTLDVCSGLAFALGYQGLLQFVELNERLQKEETRSHTNTRDKP